MRPNCAPLLATIFTLSLLLIPTVGIHAEIYKWHDENGQLHFGDRPSTQVESEVISVKPNVYETPSIETLPESIPVTSKVVMYSTTWCGFCKKAREYFTAQKIPFKEYDVENSEKGRRDYKKLDAQGVPVILVGKQRLNGFDVASFERLYTARDR